MTILEQLERNYKKKEYFDHLYKDHNKVVKKQTGYLCCKNTGGIPLRDYYAEKPRLIKLKMAKEKKKRDNQNMGIAFLTFDNSNVQSRFKKTFDENKKKLRREDPTSYYKLNCGVR